MGLLLKKQVSDHSIIGIWEITESSEELHSAVRLSEKEKKVFSAMRHEERKSQWLSTRILTGMLTGMNAEILYDDFGKPFLPALSPHISISHSGKYAAVITDRVATGIDIEIIHPRVQNITGKYMSPAELSRIGKEHGIEQLCVYWCAKEAMYKMHGKKQLIFQRDLSVLPFEYQGKGRIEGRILTETHCSLWYEKIKECMLVFIVND